MQTKNCVDVYIPVVSRVDIC